MGAMLGGMKLPQLIATATTAAVLGTAGVSIAGATSDGGSMPSSVAATAAQDQAQDGTKAGPGRGHRRARIGQVLDVAAGVIGIERTDLVAELRDGKSIADVATAHGVDPQAVVDALVQAGQERINEAVAAGTLDPERAASLEARLEERVGKLVETTKEQRRHRRAAIRRHARNAVETAAETIGIVPKDLVTELRGGDTIADVATAHGVDPQAVIDALVAEANANIQAAKESGKLTDEQAARLTERAAERITHLVNEGRKARRHQPASG
jgi:uncharacterized protein (DUF433 family)